MEETSADPLAGNYVTQERIKGCDFFFALIGIVLSSVMIGVGHQVCETYFKVRLSVSAAIKFYLLEILFFLII